jgi:O-antigen ligase
MGHWMTFSGEQMIVWCAAVPALLVLGQRWLAPLALVGTAIVLSFTRSVWLGAAAGITAVALALPRRLLVAVIAPLIVVGVISSGLIYHRIAMSFEQQNFAPDQSRLAYLDVGMQMIREHPIFGVGPERIRTEFPHYYRGTALETFYYGHLHNNIMQIGAERGLICLAAFFWFIFELYRGLINAARFSGEARWAALSALSALTGFMVAGMFEYNFGDSEVLLLLLFIVCMPFGLPTPDPSPEIQ